MEYTYKADHRMCMNAKIIYSVLRAVLLTAALLQSER
jgi:hypothetical protein